MQIGKNKIDPRRFWYSRRTEDQ